MNYKRADIQTIIRTLAQGQVESYSEILRRFDSLIRSESRVNGIVNEDVAQDIREELIKAIQKKFVSIGS